MSDPTALCGRGRAWRSRSRTQGEAFGGAKGEPEDVEMRRATRVIRMRVVVGSIIEAGTLQRVRRAGFGHTAPPVGAEFSHRRGLAVGVATALIGLATAGCGAGTVIDHRAAEIDVREGFE